MKMLSLLMTLCFLIACSSVKKTVNKSNQETRQMKQSSKDSTGFKKVENTVSSLDSNTGIFRSDDQYQKETVEQVLEWIVPGDSRDSLLKWNGSSWSPVSPRIKITNRRIKENVHKSETTHTADLKKETFSGSEISGGKEKEKVFSDSTGVSSSTQKNVSRTKWLSWWWLLIIPVVLYLTRKKWLPKIQTLLAKL